MKGMKKKKISLVLEGGGMRGAYTAGCLSWLIDEGIEFDGAYGISTGAIHLTTFLFKNKEWLKEMSTRIIANKDYIGLKAFLQEGQIVAFDHMFSNLDRLGFDIKNLKTNTKAKLGYYDLGIGDCIFMPVEKIDTALLKAACSLPLLGKITKVEGKEYLDGGINKMIPIEESVKDGYDKHLIITTKPIDYVRKPAKAFVVWLMSTVYSQCKNIGRDYRDRHINYKNQIDLINQLVLDGKALYRYPTKTIKVTRLGGSFEDLDELFELGRSDMENSREEIYKLLND